MSVFFEFDEVDAFTAGAVGEPGSADVLPPGPAPAQQRVTVKCEKQQVAAIAEYLRRVLTRPARRRRTARCRRARAAPSRSSRRSCSARSGSATTAATTGSLVQLEELVPVDDEGEPDDATRSTTAGTSALYVTRGQAAAFCDHADELVAAGRPTASGAATRSTPTATRARG